MGRKPAIEIESKSIRLHGLLLAAAVVLLFAAVWPGFFSEQHASAIRAFSILAFVVGLALLKLPQSLRRRVALAGFSLALSLYACEAVLSVVARPNKQPAQRVAPKSEFDDRTAAEVIAEMEEQGISAVPTIAPEQFTFEEGASVVETGIFPIGGVSKKCTLLGNESGVWTHYRSDEFGFNNPAGSHRPETDIVLIGDSFAQGMAVRSGEGIAELLRSENRSVVNLGVSGNGPLIELASLKEYAEPLQPAVVLWLYYEENDLFNLGNEEQIPLLRRYLNPEFSQGLRDRQGEIDDALETFVKSARTQTNVHTESKPKGMKSFMALNRIRTLVRTECRRIAWRRDKSALLPSFREVIQQAKQRTESWGGRFYFVYLPTWNRYGVDTSTETSFYRDDVLTLVRELDIPIVDFHQTASSLEDPLSIFPHRQYGHYNAEGYQLVASQIQEAIEPTLAVLDSKDPS